MAELSTLVVHIEVCVKYFPKDFESEFQREFDSYLLGVDDLPLETPLFDTVLPQATMYVRLVSDDHEKKTVNFKFLNVLKKYHFYYAWAEGPEENTDNKACIPTSLSWCLPNKALEGLWESLIFDNNIKQQLLSYAETSLLYSKNKVDCNVILWSGIILLHGPPGTGKTSLCKSLAQKLSIRLGTGYSKTQLLEIQPHCLLSKWFSESAKFVTETFSNIRNSIYPDGFYFILLDEVESLTLMRKASDSNLSENIRVVNAILTQIDQLQRYPNVLILATSNISDTIDVAFADRADLKLFVPSPSKFVIYEILRSCIEELINCGLVYGVSNDFLDSSVFKTSNVTVLNSLKNQDGNVNRIKNSENLISISEMCEKLSGRSLRKIPFLTSANFVNNEMVTVSQFLDEMKSVVAKFQNDNLIFATGRYN